MTFDAYCRARRLGRGLASLRQGEDLAAAALDAGYDSESGFREAFGEVLRADARPGARLESPRRVAARRRSAR